MPEQRTLIDATAAAERLGVTKGTLAKWRISGRGPVFVAVGRSIRYCTSDLEAWIDAQRRRSTADPGQAVAI